MNTEHETLAEITNDAIDLLCQEMGVVKTIRFINQFNKGFGDYTIEREQIFEGMSVEDIVTEIERKRESQKKN